MMLSFCSIVLVLLVCGHVTASDGSPKSDKCSDFDSCSAGDLFRTCSCDGDCYKSGTCCKDFKDIQLMSPEKKLYECHSDRTVTPVFAKKVCSKSYDGHEVHRDLCVDSTDDPADVLGTVLFTGTKSKKTYWNKNCAICNNENVEDIKQWTVQVTCPSKHEKVKFSRYVIERNLTFDKENGEWGLMVHDGFLPCSIHFLQPSSMVGRLNYCAPHMISNCPSESPDADLVKNCLMYHAERRQKSTGQYFRNVHCALCNGVSEEDLECAGRKYSPLSLEKGSDVVRATFDSGKWLQREGEEKYRCSTGNSWDPIALSCRKTPEGSLVLPTVASAQVIITPLNVLTLLGMTLVNKYALF